MQRILFVCTGNTCRSPMAEAILKNKALPDVEVRSAGVYAAQGSDASEHAKSVLKENGIDHVHVSRPLAEADVEWATLIFTMTGSHKAAILQYYPEAGEKTFTLKEFAGGETDIVDPYGGSILDYRASYQDIKESIQSVLDRLNIKN